VSTQRRTVLVLNGPNLGRLGTREPEVYGTTTHAQLAQLCVDVAAAGGWTADVRQTDDEAVMLGWLHEAATGLVPVVINPGAWSHYSYALRDAVAMVPTVLEVHISQTAAREEFRHHSVISAVVQGTITGLGTDGYRCALQHLMSR
jgi:3-dehydroquinate dehydratase-2